MVYCPLIISSQSIYSIIARRPYEIAFTDVENDEKEILGIHYIKDKESRQDLIQRYKALEFGVVLCGKVIPEYSKDVNDPNNVQLEDHPLFADLCE